MKKQPHPGSLLRPFLKSLLGACALLIPISASAQQIVFSEIMYHPPGDQPEFIEIRNNSATPFDFADWKIADGVDYTFPAFNSANAAAAFLRPYEILIVSSVTEAEFREAYPSTPASVRVFGPWSGEMDEDGTRASGFLNNAGEDLILQDKNGSTLCTLSYADRLPWSPAADGAGHSIHVINPDRRIDDWRNWKASVNSGGSPGQSEPEVDVLPLRLSEVQFDADGVLSWIEVYNFGDDAIDLANCHFGTQENLGDRVALSGSVEAGGYLRVDVAIELAENDPKFLLFGPEDRVLSAHVIEGPTVDSNYQTDPNDVNEWYLTTEATPSDVNAPDQIESIVIHEIMFDPPVGPTGEFVELYNRSTESVDLSGWEIAEAIRFTFPQGTMLAAGAYLVVAADTKYFGESYPGMTALGGFSGGLTNDGERIRLLDAKGNLADQVDYKIGGDWPELADGLGSSLELVHPDMDNSLASAWRDSDESTKAEPREYKAQVAYNSTGLWNTSTDHELHLHLVGDGYVVMEDITFSRPSSIFNPDGASLLENADKTSDNGQSSTGWLFQGTHANSFLEGNAVHLISTGRGDNRANRVEIDMQTPGGSELILKFNGRWIYGKPRVIAQTVNHGWSYEFLLDVPANLGTPGAQNSRTTEVPMPQVDDLAHSPAVPKPTENVTITARVKSIQPLEAVRVAYISDSSGGNTENIFRPWTRKAMVDDGTNGDATAGDGLYTTQITDQKVNNRIVVFYVEAITEDGDKYTLPKRGVDRPAMYIVDDRPMDFELRTVRMVMSEFDRTSFGMSGNSSKYEYKYPASSNFYRNCTLIMNESEIFYGCEARSGGSPWHTADRANLHLKGKFKMPKSIAFRDRIKTTWDQDGEIADRRHNDRLARYWLYLFGHPANDNEFFRLILNNSSAGLREEVEPVDNGFLDRHFPEGKDGQLFRVDDEWAFTDTWSQTPRDASWDYKTPGGDRAGRYHSEYMLRSREVEYDFSSLIELFRTMSRNDYTQEESERLLDHEMIAINFAVRSYIGDWDFQGLNRGKNTFFYRKVTDGRFMFMHWDSDLAFQNTSEVFLNGIGPALQRWQRQPYFRRLYYYYLNELLTKYTQGSARLDAWLEAENTATSDISANISKYNNWNNGRRAGALNFIGSDNRSMPFEISTNSGNGYETEDHVIELSGTAPIDVYNVIILGHDEAILDWTDNTEWTLSNIVLKEGENVLQIRATDREGVLLGSLFSPKQDEITVTKTTPSLPFPQIAGNPTSLNVAVSETLELDASGSIDPEGDPLTFTWEALGQAPASLTADGSLATVTFSEPGLYHFQVTASDASGNEAISIRDVSVYDTNGFSSFLEGTLEPYWTGLNAPFAGTTFQPSFYDLGDPEGQLSLRVMDDTAKPLTAVDGDFPWLHRTLPETEDWVMQTKLSLAARRFGEYQTGLLVEMNETSPTRYAFGFENGSSLTAYKVNGTSTKTALESIDWHQDQAIVRIRRAEGQLHFEYKVGDQWETLHQLDLDESFTATEGGLFLATDEAESYKIDFDYAMLIEPGEVSPLQIALRLSELMYNPADGEQYEYLEFQNVTNSAVDLNGASFSEGITFQFPEYMLEPGAFLILAKDPVAFADYYQVADVNVAPGGYEGQLSNSGETVTLTDAEGRMIFTLSYSDGGDWPGSADGEGSSLELIDLNGPINSSSNWKASEPNGTPGRGSTPPPVGDADGDGIPDAWETLNGLDPTDPSDAAMDFDGDGSSNSEEYLSGTDPQNSVSQLILRVTRSGDEIQFHFNANGDRRYAIQSGEGLEGPWTDVTEIPANTVGDHSESQTIDAESSIGFYRLRVWLEE